MVGLVSSCSALLTRGPAVCAVGSVWWGHCPTDPAPSLSLFPSLPLSLFPLSSLMFFSHSNSSFSPPSLSCPAPPPRFQSPRETLPLLALPPALLLSPPGCRICFCLLNTQQPRSKRRRRRRKTMVLWMHHSLVAFQLSESPA